MYHEVLLKNHTKDGVQRLKNLDRVSDTSQPAPLLAPFKNCPIYLSNIDILIYRGELGRTSVFFSFDKQA